MFCAIGTYLKNYMGRITCDVSNNRAYYSVSVDNNNILGAKNNNMQGTVSQIFY